MNASHTDARSAVPTTLAAHLPQLRLALEEQRRFRLEQLTALAGAPDSDDVHDQVSEILRAGAVSALTEVEHALHRLRVGSYGRCARCEVEIPLERLEILPMSCYCMRCQHAAERARRQP
jgi:RNA polymerase-binding transcription factor DksA